MNRSAWLLYHYFLIVTTSALVFSCTGDATQKVPTSKSVAKIIKMKSPRSQSESVGIPGTVGEVTTVTTALDSAWNNKEAFAFMKETCGPCHQPQKDFNPSWAMPADADLNLAWLESSSMSPTAYQAIINKIKQRKGTSPSAMPPSDVTPELKANLEKLVKWFNHNAHTVVAEAADKFGDDAVVTNVSEVNLTYKCEKLVTTREFIRRITNSAFSREPLQGTRSGEVNEFALVAPAELEVPVTDSTRMKIAAKLDTEGDPWKEEFKRTALKNFASKIAGTNAILPSQDLPIAKVADLRNEFYQLLLKFYDTTSFKDILLSPKVMATVSTAPLYGPECVQTVGQQPVAECNLVGERSNFFASVGFLRSVPSSLFVNNNNRSRHAAMYLIINGEALVANTNGKQGETIDPLPQCLLPDNDRRVIVDPANAQAPAAPLGLIAVPAFGNVCQKCHIERQVAVGELMFRPFGQDGEIIPVNVAANDSRYQNDIREATNDTKAMLDANGQRQRVDLPFLLNLRNWRLKTDFKPCIPGRNEKPDIPVNTVGDVASYLMGQNASNLYRGLSRHFPRSFSNVSSTNSEIVQAVLKGAKEGNGKLGPMIKEYFATKTFSCEVSNVP